MTAKTKKSTVTAAAAVATTAELNASVKLATSATGSFVKLRDVVTAIMLRGVTRKAYLSAVRAKLGIDEELTEKLAREASPTFAMVVNAWHQSGKVAGVVKARKPRAGKEAPKADADTGKGTRPVDAAKIAADWIATASHADLLAMIQAQRLATSCRKLGKALAASK